MKKNIPSPPPPAGGSLTGSAWTDPAVIGAGITAVGLVTNTLIQQRGETKRAKNAAEAERNRPTPPTGNRDAS